MIYKGRLRPACPFKLIFSKVVTKGRKLTLIVVDYV
jgi:hypothetical protein